MLKKVLTSYFSFGILCMEDIRDTAFCTVLCTIYVAVQVSKFYEVL